MSKFSQSLGLPVPSFWALTLGASPCSEGVGCLSLDGLHCLLRVFLDEGGRVLGTRTHQALLGNLARASRNPTPKFSWGTLRLAVGANDSANGLERGRCAMSTTITSYAATTTA